MYTIKRCLLFFALFLLASKGIGQIQFDDKSRAEYILSISKYVVWANEANIDTFKVGVIDTDTNLVHELRLYASTIKNRKGKPIKINYFKNIESLKGSQVIFVNKKDNIDISKVYKRIKGTNSLLISENYPFHKSMINFIVVNEQKNFEVNKDKIDEEGFYVSETFLALAIHTKADWEKIYEQAEYLLQKEKAIVRSQKALIAQQQQDIEEQIELLDMQANLIKAQQQEIDTQRLELNKLEKKIIIKQKRLHEKSLLLEKQKVAIDKKEKELKAKQRSIEESNITLALQKNEISKQANKILEQKSTLNQQLKAIEKQRLILYFFFIVIVLILVVAYSIFRNYRNKKRANLLLKEKNKKIGTQRDELLERNEEIMQQKEEILSQRDEIEKHRDDLIIKNAEIKQQKEEILAQRDEIEKQRDVAENQRDKIQSQNKQITDSIIAAKRIQSAILTLPEFIDDFLKQYFILFKPKDIVSGDFYWTSKQGDKIVIAAVDCTGHGVPGAFMSMLGVTFLSEIVEHQKITEPARILNELREDVIQSLKQSGKIGEVKEGMDMSICSIDIKTQRVEFAGASNPLILIRDNELIEYKGDKMPVSIIDEIKPFTNHTFDLKKDDVIYMYSDGYADQFGGKYRRKFLSKRLKNLLLEIHELPMQEQHNILESTFNNWIEKGNYDQIDDVLVIGVRY